MSEGIPAEHFLIVYLFIIFLLKLLAILSFCWGHSHNPLKDPCWSMDLCLKTAALYYVVI